MDSSLKEKISNSPIVDRLKLLGAESTFHGVLSFTKTRHLSVKILYAIFFMICFCFCITTLASNFQDFLNFKVKTVVELHHHDADEEFPTVTICEKQICAFTDYEYNNFIGFFIHDTYNQSGDLTE